MAFVSLRGAAYFAASVHICVGIFYFAVFFARLATPRRDGHLDYDTISMGTESLAYYGLVLPLGIVIFRGIDKESRSVLTWSAIVFFALQLFGFATRMRYNYIFASNRGDSVFGSYPDAHMVYHRGEEEGPLILKGVGMATLLTVAYLLVLFFYIRQLTSSSPGRILSGHFQPITTTTTTTSVAYYVNPPEGIPNIQGVCNRTFPPPSSSALANNSNVIFNGPSRSFPPCYHPQHPPMSQHMSPALNRPPSASRTSMLQTATAPSTHALANPILSAVSPSNNSDVANGSNDPQESGHPDSEPLLPREEETPENKQINVNQLL